MECAVDDPDYKNESNFINSLMQRFSKVVLKA